MQNKDQRSDGLTYKLLGVFIHRRLKQAMRILGSEDGLNNYQRAGTRGLIKQSKTLGRHGPESQTIPILYSEKHTLESVKEYRPYHIRLVVLHLESSVFCTLLTE